MSMSSLSSLASLSPRETASLSIHETIQRFSTSLNGLTNDEAEQRRSLGENILPKKKEPNFFFRVLRQFCSPLIAILMISAALMPFVGRPEDAYVILAILILNAVVGALQEGRASRALQLLESHSTPIVDVLRGGVEQRISIFDLRLGDLLPLREGVIVPADGRIIQHVGLRIDESTLTGESSPVGKTSDPLPTNNHAALADLRNAAFRGTHVVAGHGLMLVTAIGSETEIGRIALSIVQRGTEPPLAKKIAHISRIIAIIVGVFSVCLFGIGLLVGRPIVLLFATVVTLAVSIIPEGLPVVLTIVLARGVRRMARHHAVVKQLNAVEGLGNVDVICTDKTGTLTVNEQNILHVLTPKTRYTVEGHGYEPHGHILSHGERVRFGDHSDLDRIIIAAAALGEHAIRKEHNEFVPIGDPVNSAFLALSQRGSFHSSPWRIIDERPFSFEERCRYIQLESKTGQITSYMAGSPETVFAKCIDDGFEQEFAFEEYARHGLRVVALAYRDGDIPFSNTTTPWHCAGYVAMGDTLRPDAATSVAWCHQNGIRVVMVTGDHPETALAIAKDVGLAATSDNLLRGDELDAMDDAALTARLTNITVFARITPAHKLRIVNAYRANELITAMTGDGVNDAPALRAADIGIAMGKHGTDVAREACDLVLLDDRFATIVAAIQEGRSISGNVRKVISYLFSTNIAEAIVLAVTLLSGAPILLLPVQILWLNLITDGFLDISLAMEPPHKRGKPRAGGFLDTTSLFRIFLLGGVMAGGTLFVYFLFIDRPAAQLQTLTLLVLAVFQWFNAWSARSESTSLTRLSLLSNPYLIIATCIIFVLQLAALYSPLSSWLHTAPLPMLDWILAALISLTVVLADEWWKHRFRRAQHLAQHTA